MFFKNYLKYSFPTLVGMVICSWVFPGSVWAESICGRMSHGASHLSGDIEITRFVRDLCARVSDTDYKDLLHEDTVAANNSDSLLTRFYETIRKHYPDSSSGTLSVSGSASGSVQPSPSVPPPALRSSDLGQFCELTHHLRNAEVETRWCQDGKRRTTPDTADLRSFMETIHRLLDETRKKTARLEFTRYFFELEQLATEGKVDVSKVENCSNINRSQGFLMGTALEATPPADAFWADLPIPCITFKAVRPLEGFDSFMQAPQKKSGPLGSWFIPRPEHISEVLPISRLQSQLVLGQREIGELVRVPIPVGTAFIYGPIKPSQEGSYTGHAGKNQLFRPFIDPEKFPELLRGQAFSAVKKPGVSPAPQSSSSPGLHPSSAADLYRAQLNAFHDLSLLRALNYKTTRTDEENVKLEALKRVQPALQTYKNVEIKRDGTVVETFEVTKTNRKIIGELYNIVWGARTAPTQDERDAYLRTLIMPDGPGGTKLSPKANLMIRSLTQSLKKFDSKIDKAKTKSGSASSEALRTQQESKVHFLCDLRNLKDEMRKIDTVLVLADKLAKLVEEHEPSATP